ncbi:hypothetical protein D9M70_616850 [compost metagenome]
MPPATSFGSRQTGGAGARLESVKAGVAGNRMKSPPLMLKGSCPSTASTAVPSSTMQKLGFPYLE